METFEKLPLQKYGESMVVNCPARHGRAGAF